MARPGPYLRDLPPEEAAKIREAARKKRAADEENRAHAKRRALELRAEGKTTHQIGKELGVSHVTVSRYISAALKDITREPAEEVLALELDRIDGMFVAAYKKAKNGHLPSIDRCIRLMDRRSKYLGLDRSTDQNAPTDYATLKLQVARHAARIALTHPDMTADQIAMQVSRETT